MYSSSTTNISSHICVLADHFLFFYLSFLLSFHRQALLVSHLNLNLYLNLNLNRATCSSSQVIGHSSVVLSTKHDNNNNHHHQLKSVQYLNKINHFSLFKQCLCNFQTGSECHPWSSTRTLLMKAPDFTVIAANFRPSISLSRPAIPKEHLNTRN